MPRKRILSFKYAGEGIWGALKTEPNLKFHFFAAFLVYVLGIYFKISRIDWMILIIVIGVVLSLELTNTAIETVVNSFTEDIHPAAKKAKDVAAGAVLISAITAIAIGILVFWPYVTNL
jgi:diacylglycerol kinase